MFLILTWGYLWGHMFLLLSKIKEGKERESADDREKHQSVASPKSPDRDWTRNLVVYGTLFPLTEPPSQSGLVYFNVANEYSLYSNIQSINSKIIFMFIWWSATYCSVKYIQWKNSFASHFLSSLDDQGGHRTSNYLGSGTWALFKGGSPQRSCHLKTWLRG